MQVSAMATTEMNTLLNSHRRARGIWMPKSSVWLLKRRAKLSQEMVVGIHFTDSPALMMMSVFSLTEPVTIQYSGKRKKIASKISKMTVMTK